VFVIQRCDDGSYVARPGSVHSYTKKLQDARVFSSREDAERERCGNETIVPVSAILST
jgi:hypothetical protein